MKIIIWGHKLHQSTHSYIHSSYYKAFKHLGYEVYWLDKTDNVNLDWSDAVFFLEDSVKDGIPINKTVKYITHHVNTEYFTNLGVPYENILKLGNYLPSLEKYEKVNDFAYWDGSQRCLYQCWGTNLLPHEINVDSPIKFNPQAKTLNYVGMFYEQGPWWAQNFADIIYEKHKVKFNVFTQNASDDENRELIQQSFLCPDFRSNWHLQCGYIPCRIFKNISYGRITGTNSPYVKAAFGDFVVFGGTPDTLYENLLNAEMNSTVNMRDAMNLIKEKHTFINRVNNILNFL